MSLEKIISFREYKKSGGEFSKEEYDSIKEYKVTQKDMSKYMKQLWDRGNFSAPFELTMLFTSVSLFREKEGYKEEELEFDYRMRETYLLIGDKKNAEHFKHPESKSKDYLNNYSEEEVKDAIKFLDDLLIKTELEQNKSSKGLNKTKNKNNKKDYNK